MTHPEGKINGAPQSPHAAVVDNARGAVRDLVQGGEDSEHPKTPFEALADALPSLELERRRDQLLTQFDRWGLTQALMERGIVESKEALAARFEMAAVESKERLEALNENIGEAPEVEMIFDPGGLLPQELIQILFTDVGLSLDASRVDLGMLRRINPQLREKINASKANEERKSAILEAYQKGESLKPSVPHLTFLNSNPPKEMNENILYLRALIDQRMPEIAQAVQKKVLHSVGFAFSREGAETQLYINPVDKDKVRLIQEVHDFKTLDSKTIQAIVYFAGRWGIIHPFLPLKEGELWKMDDFMLPNGEVPALAYYAANGLNLTSTDFDPTLKPNPLSKAA